MRFNFSFQHNEHKTRIIESNLKDESSLALQLIEQTEMQDYRDVRRPIMINYPPSIKSITDSDFTCIF